MLSNWKIRITHFLTEFGFLNLKRKPFGKCEIRLIPVFGNGPNSDKNMIGYAGCMLSPYTHNREAIYDEGDPPPPSLTYAATEGKLQHARIGFGARSRTGSSPSRRHRQHEHVHHEASFKNPVRKKKRAYTASARRTPYTAPVPPERRLGSFGRFDGYSEWRRSEPYVYLTSRKIMSNWFNLIICLTFSVRPPVST